MASYYDHYVDIFVPMSTYKVVHHYQMVYGLSPEELASDRPVAMAGCLNSRIAKRGSARHYGTEVLKRYIRRLRLTETDRERWYHWVWTDLLPVGRKRTWWGWQKKCSEDISQMVCEYSIVIDGIGYDIYDQEHRRNVERLARAAKRYMGRLPRQSPGHISSKTAQ
jgi:hypothetical protein